MTTVAFTMITAPRLLSTEFTDVIDSVIRRNFGVEEYVVEEITRSESANHAKHRIVVSLPLEQEQVFDKVIDVQTE